MAPQKLSILTATCTPTMRLLLRTQTTNRNVINDLLNFLNIILERIETFTQSIIFQIQQTKSTVQI
jgi:hypothetical protein